MQKKRLNVQFSTTCERKQGQKTADRLVQSSFLLCTASTLHDCSPAWCTKQQIEQAVQAIDILYAALYIACQVHGLALSRPCRPIGTEGAKCSYIPWGCSQADAGYRRVAKKT